MSKVQQSLSWKLLARQPGNTKIKERGGAYEAHFSKSQKLLGATLTMRTDLNAGG